MVAALAKASADDRPLLVTIEDVHWADPETLSFLAAITRATAMSRTMLVMTTRIEGDPLDAHWRSIAGGGTLITLDLLPCRLPTRGRSRDASSASPRLPINASSAPAAIHCS